MGNTASLALRLLGASSSVLECPTRLRATLCEKRTFRGRRLKIDPRRHTLLSTLPGRCANEGHFDRWIGGDGLVEMERRIQTAKTAAENHDLRVDRRFIVFRENMSQPKMVNKPEVRQHHSKHQQSDNVCANHNFRFICSCFGLERLPQTTGSL